ncbi:MAG: VWA domain-containing protein [Vicinamibacteria bacterium]|nr:VWA domain-containing protein [Vicinamibacteria bacterium]
MTAHARWTLGLVALVVASVAFPSAQQSAPRQDGDGFRFRTGVELINISASVTDASGRFVSGLRQDDFVLYEDGVEQPITHFSNERVPVSLGLVIDTSGSMAGEKWDNARSALDRFLLELLGPDDEVFLYQFDSDPYLLEGWTTDRPRLSRAIGRIVPRGGTAMYDTLAEAVPLADSGQNRKKAIVVISDGNDTHSSTAVSDLKRLIRETEVLVYAIGIDGEGEFTSSGGVFGRPPVRLPFPFPLPGRRRPYPGQPPWGGGTTSSSSRSNDRVNAGALRELTDDSGGRTEIVRTSRDLDPATSNIADELSQQYFLAYPAAAKKDGRWHTIRVEVRDQRYRVRARKGYMAT